MQLLADALEMVFSKVWRYLQKLQIYQKEIPTQLFSCEYLATFSKAPFSHNTSERLLMKFTGNHYKKRTIACNFLKKETMEQVFFREFYQISKSTFFTEHLLANASENPKSYQKQSENECTIDNCFKKYHLHLCKNICYMPYYKSDWIAHL